MKIYHFADIHFSEKDHDEIEKCMDFLISNSKKDTPDVFVCSGDIFNSQYLGLDTKSSKTVARQFREMSDIAPVVVVIGTPSHELLAPELLRNVSGKFPIHVSTTIEQVVLCETLDGLVWSEPNSSGQLIKPKLVVSQVPPPSKAHWKNRQGIEKDNANISEAMGAIFANFGVMAGEYPDAVHILNGHFSMQGSKISETQLLPGGDIAIDKNTLALADADAYLLGHIHMRQEYDIPGGDKKAFHSGSIFRKDFGERGVDKGFYIYNIHKQLDMVESDFIKTPTRRMDQMDYDLIKSPHLLTDIEEDFTEKVLAWFNENSSPGSWVKITIKAWMDDIRMINQSRLKKVLVDAGAHDPVILEIDRVRRENSRDEEIVKATTLPEKVKALANHRSQPAPEGVYEMLPHVETLNTADLVEYALSRIV